MKRIIKASEDRVTVKVEYYPYERYGGSGDVLRRARVSGKTLLEALTKMTGKMHLYVHPEWIEEDDLQVEDILRIIEESNGDGADYVTSIVNMNTGEELLHGDWRPEEEDWDEDWE